MIDYMPVMIQIAAVDEGLQGPSESYQNSDDEAEHNEDAADYYQAEDDDYEVQCTTLVNFELPRLLLRNDKTIK